MLVEYFGAVIARSSVRSGLNIKTGDDGRSNAPRYRNETKSFYNVDASHPRIPLDSDSLICPSCQIAAAIVVDREGKSPAQ
jgi:hypothetical protein